MALAGLSLTVWFLFKGVNAQEWQRQTDKAQNADA